MQEEYLITPSFVTGTPYLVNDDDDYDLNAEKTIYCLIIWRNLLNKQLYHVL